MILYLQSGNTNDDSKAANTLYDKLSLPVLVQGVQPSRFKAHFAQSVVPQQKPQVS
ncbi:MAG TPA: hypothetical protein VMA35_12110 [Candidatus Sulfopaludibacter sp.]|nr:hypothetical protein [Candidatus Sulfopaludibacter sp.]